MNENTGGMSVTPDDYPRYAFHRRVVEMIMDRIQLEVENSIRVSTVRNDGGDHPQSRKRAPTSHSTPELFPKSPYTPEQHHTNASNSPRSKIAQARRERSIPGSHLFSV